MFCNVDTWWSCLVGFAVVARVLKIVTRLFCNVDTWWSVLVGFKLVARVWVVAKVLKSCY